jgi:predicted metal-binding protein
MPAKKRRTARGGVVPREIAWVELAGKCGALGARVIAAGTVETGEWVRWKCQFGCDGFGSSRVCPPHAPGPVQTRALLDGYRRAILFEAPPGQAKRIAVKLERELFLAGHYKAFGLGAGPCELCESCAFEEGCRHAEEARPSMEACGIDVFGTARKHGFTINVVRTHKDPQHYFGLVLVD